MGLKESNLHNFNNMPMCDLNILWTPVTPLAAIDRQLRWAAHLGYDTVALNHVITCIPSGEIVNPLPKITRPLDGSAPSATTTISVSKPPAPQASFPKQILHRATVHISDPSNHHRLGQMAQLYDILAVRPTSKQAFQTACISSPDASIISLDMTVRLPFFLKHKNVSTAIKRGVFFEVCYAHMFEVPSGASTNSTTLATLFANWEQLFSSSRGRGIIISSESSRKVSMRSPPTVRNLLGIYGLADEKGHTAQTELPRLVFKNELLKRRSRGGVVEIVKAATALGHSAEHVQLEKESEMQRDQSDNAGTKRKASAEENSTMSKRQVKRLRKQLREQEELDKTS